MALRMTRLRRAVLLGAFVLGTFAINTNVAAAQTPPSALLVVCRGRGDYSLAIIDPLNGELVGRVPISGGGLPHEITVSADGKHAFVTRAAYAKDFRDSTEIPNGGISIINLGTQRELRLFDVGFDSIPHGIVYAGGKVFFTAEGYQIIGRYDPANNLIDWMFGTGHGATHMLTVSKDTNRIFVTSTETDTVIVIEPAEQQGDHAGFHPSVATLIPVGKQPGAIALSPDEQQVWVLNRGESSVSIISVATKKVLETLGVKVKDPLRLHFAPNGKQVVIIDESGEVLVLDAVTREEIKRIRVDGLLHGILISPDSSTAYVSVYDGSKILILDLKELEVTGSISTPAEPEAMAWAQGM